MKKYLIILFVVIIIIPSVASAAWWNPFSWNWGSFIHKNKITIENVSDNKIEEITQPSFSTKKDILQTDTAPIEVTKTIKPKTLPSTVSGVPKNETPQVLGNIESSPKNIPSTTSEQYQTPLYVPDQTANKAQILLRTYNEDVSAINQQIIDIKKQYYIDVAEIQSQPISLQFMNGRIDKLTTDNNTKISQLNLQIDQITVDYNNKINQLNNY